MLALDDDYHNNGRFQHAWYFDQRALKVTEKSLYGHLHKNSSHRLVPVPGTVSNGNMKVLVDVTDLVEFLQRQESVSGVQRVVAETVPLLIAFPNHSPILLDRHRGEFVELTASEAETLIDQGARAESTQTDRAHFSRTPRKWTTLRRCF